MNFTKQILHAFTALALCVVASSQVWAAELNVRVQYFSRSNDVILTGVQNGEMEMRPKGADTGGRAYMEIEELQRQRVRLIFLFPQAYYDAVEQLDQGKVLLALPVLEKAAAPMLDYMELGVVPGNLVPTVLSYLDALQSAQRWDEAARVAQRIPLQGVPRIAFDYVGDLALTLHDEGQTEAANRVHTHIISTQGYDEARLALAMDVADAWRDRGEFKRAFQLYQKIQVVEGPQQTLARLWVAYCSFYLGHDLVPKVFLEVLPEMEPNDTGYSLRELIKARLAIRDESYDDAMRSAAEGKVYANAIDPWYPELLYTTALLYQQRGMNDAALAAYREVAILFTDSPWAAESLKALENLTPEVSAL